MVDFLEYVVGELKHKRLAKADALALVQQFSRGSSPRGKTALLHPLLHSNTSDLSEQRYRSTFRGDEFFLVDHQVKRPDHDAQKVLPGMACLEMARAAIAQALPTGAESAVELRNVVWVHPIVVAGPREIGISLSASEGGEIAFEIYSQEGEEEIVHCQGQAVSSLEPAPDRLDLEALAAEMGLGEIEPTDIYAAFARMGLLYGPTFQGITAVRRGNGQALARLRLPTVLEAGAEAFVLHPSLADSALQASAGLFGELSELSGSPRLPFALASVRIVSPLTREMAAWVRVAPDSSEAVVKLDVDLCDPEGNICVQMRGVSTRVLSADHDRRAAQEGPAIVAQSPSPLPAADQASTLAEKTEDYFRRQFSGLLKVPSDEIDARAPLENYGIDSMLAMKLTNQLETTFGSLSKTLFFEFQTVRDLADYFVRNHTEQLTALFGTPAKRQDDVTRTAAPAATPAETARPARRRSGRAQVGAFARKEQDERIAIIGLSGRYPEAVNVEAYWRNLRDGKDCIVEVPRERWDWQSWFSSDRTKSGQHYSKWGGFIEGVDEFDPLFFNIAPLEAEIMDPQERLFLQHVWMAVEDAGYTRSGLQVPDARDLSGQAGVYVGVMYNEYQLFGAEASLQGRRVGIAGSVAGIANRVSYVLDVHGPSMTVDTMCSSSLTAIHLACQDLRQGRTSVAIAGGVNVTIHPNKYLALSAGQFISSDGHCQSFGEGGDGYIPGEGVGVVVLKRLSDAERDGDQIYGVIRGSALNHGGKTNGYTVPNPQAQASAIRRALRESQTDARHVSYIEAHGTGTKLGDPIEIAALSRAFRDQTDETEFCLIGSAKSNIGHCESAAGIAGLTKVLLQMKHRQIVPSLHSEQLNPHIDFEKSPFRVNQTLRAWDVPVVDGRSVPRIAGISSFGAGGSNAHMVIEEYVAAERPAQAEGDVLIVLSARTGEQLWQKAADLLAYLREEGSSVDLGAVSYTLQVGREAMDERLALVVCSAEQLVLRLQAYVAGQSSIEDGYQGKVKRGREALSALISTADLQPMVETWIAARKYSKLAGLWVNGLEVDWSKLHGPKPRRVSLPVYPFARERYWIDVPAPAQIAAPSALHPLLHRNTSDLHQQRYGSTFTGREFFLEDHHVRGGKVLPGVAYLEMARAAIDDALPAPSGSRTLELRDVVWAQPIVVSAATEVSIALTSNATDDDEVDFEIFTKGDGEEIVHCQGRAIRSAQPPLAALDLAQIERSTADRVAPADLYAACADMGLVYGPSLQGITELRRGVGQVLAQLRLPNSVTGTWGDYVLHPALMDSALQAAAGLLDGLTEGRGATRMPFALKTLRIAAPCTPAMTAWVRYAPGSRPDDTVIELDIDLCDERGAVCVQLHGFSSRLQSLELGKSAAAPAETISVLMAVPVWRAEAETAGGNEYAEQHVVLCGRSTMDADTLRALLPGSRVLSLPAEPETSLAQRYTDVALACFDLIQTILQTPQQRKVLVQLVVPDDRDQALFAGLSGLLRTAALENPKLSGQLLLVPSDMTTETLARHLAAETAAIIDPLIRYGDGTRHHLVWEELPANASKESPSAFKDQGVYLITGGLGGLGLLFAREILGTTHDTRVVLTGRAAPTAATEVVLSELSVDRTRLSYRQVDLGDLDDVTGLIAGIEREHGRLDGILHSAGMIADGFLRKKARAQFAEVLAPKVTGTFHLDRASRDVDLDFFVLFSSIAGAMGNHGQADYATANGFMDHFAAYRNAQVAAGERRGRTRSIAWPLWQDGGMHLDASGLELMKQMTGMLPMQTETGLQAFHRSLSSPHERLLVMEGDHAQMRRIVFGESAPPAMAEPPRNEPQAAFAIGEEGLADKTQAWLRKELAAVMKMPAHKVDPNAPLEEYGIDSILAVKLTNQLEKTFGALAKTLFFEYQTIAALAGYFASEHATVVRTLLGLVEEGPALAEVSTQPERPVVARRRASIRAEVAKPAAQQDIAIIGLAGRYPQAANLDEFWQNLQSGKDCITEIPADRWDHSRFFDPDPNKLGKSYSKWGGFIAGVDQFDPLFFNISPREAALMDPQERLFLETAWQTIEDAGYTKAGIAGRRVGVYVGVMWGQYELFGAELLLSRDAALPSSSHASIANRVSYFFDLVGPSMALDTMCSSSLTAIHLACEELRKGEIEAAIAGGVNLTLHPYKYLSLSQGKFAASDGRCRSFGAGGDGYVPGEGVGAVLLKPLDKAIRDGDRIHAVIRSSAVNHGGKTNGYTVPNPNAQSALILDALAKAKVDPATLSYVETHGTGTSLGDPIEVAGLAKAFGEGSGEKQFCPIGSVKSNIGHLEAAAGIAAVTKALLQLRHGQLVPSIHAAPLNPNIDFAGTPFYVQTDLAEWRRPAAYPRRAGVSSFGAGGSNAHLILEEYVDRREPVSAPASLPFVLSARNPETLRRYAERVVAALREEAAGSLAELAYTSQVGRTPMDARLAVVASSVDELRTKLDRWIARDEVDDVFYGEAKKADSGAGSLIAGPAGRAFVETLLHSGDLEKLARLWTLGVDVDWTLLYPNGTPRKVALPAYPFARERYWIELASVPPRAVAETSAAVVVAAPPPVAVAEKATVCLVPEWTPRELAAIGPVGGPVLLLDVPDRLAAAMNESAGSPAVRFASGCAFEEVEPNVFVLDPEREEQFGELLETLANRVQYPSLIVHHSGACDPDDRQAIARQLDGQVSNGMYALFHLCRALTKRQTAASIVSVASSPLGAAMSGFLKTLTLENPKFRGKVVEIASGAEARIWDELCETEWTAQEIRYDGEGRRSVRRLVLNTPTQDPAAPLPLRRNGVYLITGGLGKLGVIFAEYLARNFQAKLVLLGHSAPTAAHDEKLQRLRQYGAEVLCVHGDVARLEDVERVVGETKARFSRIDGVIHAAGIHRDAFIVRKTREQIDEVLASKVYGTINLDLATRGENVELFVLFSSVSGVMGNPGQSDYAYGNRFLDAFAELRPEKRSGRTLSIGWPLWEEGGMRLSAEEVARLEEQSGISPLPTSDGIRVWEELLRSGASQGIPLYGNPSRLAAFAAPRVERVPLEAVRAIETPALLASTESYLKERIGDEIELAPDRIGSSDRFESLGVDSVMINRFNARLEKDFPGLPKTLLYEHETVHDLAAYLVREHREALIARFDDGVGSGAWSDQQPAPAVTQPQPIAAAPAEPQPAAPAAPEAPRLAERDDEAIAIIGIHGYYPRAASLDDYWENLKNGRDLVSLVPANRWSYEELYDADPAAARDGKVYCKWGAFVDDHDTFDPRFFNIPTEEAKILDPQERLFLQSVWAAIENAGYTRDSLRKRFPKAHSADVGIFVGVTTNSYQLLNGSALPWSIANRVSYFFDFNGPSMPVDTACSSSLVALHLACESLRRGECQVAVAGGVNLYLHPSKYLSLCQRRMLSTGGATHSYGAGDDGFVPGEAIGTVVLKPLRQAVADGDRIDGIIRGSAYEHSGRSNGYSAPNPNAQANLISRALHAAGVHPESISYVEGHGTGTQLGDSLEIAALTQAFRRQTGKQQFCPVGSVKANLGHSESAAGIAGLTKVLLQLQHGQLAPSIHSDEVNPNIELEESPFFLQHELAPWTPAPGQPRLALINSFGAGGVNACLIVEEYRPAKAAGLTAAPGPFVFVLSARNEERLREYAHDLSAHLQRVSNVDLSSVCYTLQTGRETMEERLAVVVSSVDDLVARLGDWRQHGSAIGIHRGSLGPRRSSSKRAPTTGDGRSVEAIAAGWVAGEEVEWTDLYQSKPPARIPLPTYPFARERYWVSERLADETPIRDTAAPAEAELHPLLSYNASTLGEVRFSSSLSESAFYAVDHQVHEERIFPGAGFLEMACIAGNIAGDRRVRKITDVVWSHPLRFGGGAPLLRTVLTDGGDAADYVISSFDDENQAVPHSEGRLIFSEGTEAIAVDRVSIEELKGQCAKGDDPAAFYEKFRRLGLHYGPAFRTVQEIWVNGSIALSRLAISDQLKHDFESYVLHPSLIDGALQTVAGLVGAWEPATPYLPFALDEVQLLQPLPQLCYAHVSRAAGERSAGGIRKFDIQLLSESGELLVRLKNLFVRALPIVAPLSVPQATEWAPTRSATKSLNAHP
jgi:polyketide synthase PksN